MLFLESSSMLERASLTALSFVTPLLFAINIALADSTLIRSTLMTPLLKMCFEPLSI